MTIAWLFAPVDDVEDDFGDERQHRIAESLEQRQQQRDETVARRDRELVELLRSPNDALASAGIERAIDAHFDALIRFAYGLLRSADAAEDVVQEVFVRVWELRAALRPEKSLRAYLYTAVRRRALDHLKHRDVEARHATELAAAPRSVTLSVDEKLDAAAVRRAVMAAVSRLPERRRTALRLRYDEMLPFATVGEVMGISEKAAKDLVARTVRELRELLGV